MENRIRAPRGRGTAIAITAVLAIQPLAATAQTVTIPAPVNQPGVIRWWHGAIVVGSLTGLMLLDKPVQRYAQDNRSTSGNDLAAGFRHFGQPEVYGTITLGILGAGLISGNQDITRAGGRLATTLALAGATSSLGKFSFGRPRPSQSLDADGYVPFSGQQAMPSGHATMAFALATTLADDIHNTWASVGLYTAATGVAWSRINDNKHWLTDVAAGAVIGVTSSKLISGRWRIFNLHPPRFLLGPGHATVAWRFTF